MPRKPRATQRCALDKARAISALAAARVRAVAVLLADRAVHFVDHMLRLARLRLSPPRFLGGRLRAMVAEHLAAGEFVRPALGRLDRVDFLSGHEVLLRGCVPEVSPPLI